MPKENFVHEYIHRPIVKNISYNNMKLAKLRKFEFVKSILIFQDDLKKYPEVLTEFAA